MLIDARSLPNGFELETDVCIIGAGPAGLTLARELSGGRFRVWLVESGGRDLDPAAQQLARLAALPTGASDLDVSTPTRRRQLGGTAHDWRVVLPWRGRGLRYVPLSEEDFEERPWVPHSGWPFARRELHPYYERAHALCGLGPATYGAAAWESLGSPRLALLPDDVETTIEQVGEARVFSSVLPREVAKAPAVSVLLHASAGELEPRTGAPGIERVRLDRPGGGQGTVRARLFVLAAGAVDNARLLLLSRAGSLRGLGNEHGLVGRFYMDHQRVDAASWRPSDPAVFERAELYDLRRVRGSWVSGRLSLSEARRRRERLLHAAAYLVPEPPPAHGRALRALQSLLSELRAGRVVRSAEAWRAVTPGLGYVATTGVGLALAQRRLPPWTLVGWSRLPGNRRRFASFTLQLQIELAPDPENRIVLSEERDAFGRPRAAVRWRWGELDRRSLEVTRRLLAEAIASAGLGDVELPPLGDPPQVTTPEGAHHQLGTTRMHRDPHRGVVDPHGRVHAVDNLFVTGSSVFPTGGHANPMLTIVALALRLADHLHARLREAPRA